MMNCSEQFNEIDKIQVPYLSTAVNGEISSSFALLRRRCLMSSYLITDKERLIYCSWFIAMRISPFTLSASSSNAI